ncbi:MAG TPA: DUF2238 domain-containing protein [Gemmatimonadaceae bacterium]|nr:DUF2238 domain-containing protein [Gemmatimonadaceae bacterium]
MTGKRLPLTLLVVGTIALVLSAIHAHDMTTWMLEVAPIFIGVPVLIVTAKRFPLTPLLYWLIFFHALVLMVGGHYTYARVPIGNWVQHQLGLARNDYDRLGHFMQGFVPALIAREVLLRKTPLQRGGWLFFIVTCIALAISASYELFEWCSAVIGGSSATDFLGTQGDPWDTQWDMFTALCASIIAQLTMSGVQDRQMAALPKE